LGGGEKWDFLYYQDKGQNRGYDTVTIRIELIPTVSHCIETVAKREYWRSVDEYLKKRKEGKELEEKIELLRSFLETEDFGILRRQSEKHLMNGKQVKFTLSIRNGKQAHEMTVEKHTREKMNAIEKNLVINRVK